MRTQKEQLDEKYETLKLSHDITQQRMKNLENDLEFYKRQCEQLESGAKPQREVCQTSEDNFNLIIDTNKRLKEELDAVNAENTRLNDDIVKLTDEVSNLKTNLNASELKSQTSIVENSFLKTEVKKLKERIDLFYSQSDMADEWARVQAELQEAHNKNMTLTDMINELRTNLTDSNSRYDTLLRDFDAQKAALVAEQGNEIEKVRQQCEVEKSQIVSERQKIQQDFETLKADRLKREEMFKTLVNELKDIVTNVQKEFQLKDVDWSGAKGPASDRVRIIKEEISQVKKLILDKIRSDKEELAKKTKQVEESQTDMGPMNKKLEEYEQKIKEKETKIGQMNNFILTTRTKIQNNQKQIEDLTRELNELKSQNPQIGGDQVTRGELDQLKSKFLQSQVDNEKLKKDLAASNQALTEASSKLNALTTSTSSSSLVTSPSSSQTTSSTETSSLSQQQQPPTAYIAPSRIATKIAPSQQQPQQQHQNGQNLLSSRRTAAVQPTPHITQSNVDNQQQWAQAQEQLAESEEIRVQQQDFQEAAPSTSRDANMGSFMSKRTREEDM